MIPLRWNWYRWWNSAAALLLVVFTASPARSAAGNVPVTLRVRTAGGGLIEQAYVALVPEWRPSTRPLIEEIAKNGVWAGRVPAGTYWLIGGAKGFAVGLRGPLALSDPSGMNLEIVLSPLKPIQGIVRDDHGRPIAGVRVSGINGAVMPPLGTLSELAVRHLASDFSATAGSDGRWSGALPDGDVPLIFEAPGRAAVWRIHSKNGPATMDVTLSVAAMLKVTTDRVDPSLVLTLLREGTNTPEEIPADEQPRIWARWVRTRVLTWSSLLPGTYGIYAKDPDAHDFMQEATKLASVTLAAGKQGEARVALPPVRRAATSSGALFLRGISGKELGDAIEAFGHDAGGNSRRVDPFVEQAMGGTVVWVKTDGVHGPFYGMTNHRFFFSAPDLGEANLRPDAEPWPATVYPRADARFQLRFAEKDLQPPRSGIAMLHGCGRGDRVAVPITIDVHHAAAFTARRAVRLRFSSSLPSNR